MSVESEVFSSSSHDTSVRVSRYSSPDCFTQYARMMQEYGNQVFSMARLALDVQTGLIEKEIFRNSCVSKGIGVQHGNGEDVVLLPGFGGDNSSLFDLYSFLQITGSKPHFSLSGVNEIKYDNLLEIEATLESLIEQGKTPDMIAHSASGPLAIAAKGRLRKKYGREVVNNLITLGSPVTLPLPGDNDAEGVGNPLVSSLARITMMRDPKRLALQEAIFTELPEEHDPNKLLCIFSETDPVVNSKYAQRPDATNIQVKGSHVGLANNIAVAIEIRRRLAA